MIHIKPYLLFIRLALIIASYPLCASPPDWDVNEEEFQYTANINAFVKIDGQPALSIGDRVALFVNDEIRGVSTPVPVGGSLFHFITVYANQAVGEEMEIRVYHALNDEIYTAFTTYTFHLQEVAGNLQSPFKIEVRTDGDFPISLQSIPVQSTLQGFPFTSIDLSLYLEQNDTDPVVWDASDNPLLNTIINGSILQVTVNDPNWFGSTTLVISALELGINSYFAFEEITFEVEQAFLGPLWDVFIGESVFPGQSFSNITLNELEIQHEGNCLAYSFQPIFEVPQPPIPQPNWQADIFSTPNSMPIIAQVQFTPAFLFDNPNDVLGAFINDEVRGATEPLFVNGQVYYFLQVQNEIPNAIINLKFYSASYQQIFDLPYTLSFNGIEGIGSIETPIQLDFSPFVFNINDDSVTEINVQDENWQGFQSYLFTVADCNYPDLLLDQTEVTYCVDEDNDDDGFCNLIDPAPEDRCIPDYYPPVIEVLNEQATSIYSQQATAHDADFGDCTKSLSWTLKIAELCEVPQIDLQIVCEDAEVTPTASAVLQTTGMDESTFNLVVQASVGINQLQITATDSDGHKSTFEYQIEVTDTHAPVSVCQFAQVWLNPEGLGILMPEEIFNTALSYDNCSIEHLSVSKSDYDCSNLGNNSVTLTATDKAGNSSSCSTSVSVVPGGELPQNWQSTDIGQVTVGNTYFFDPCTAAEVEEGEYTLVGSGNNATSSTTDNVAFAGQSICGDASITAKIESITPNGYGGLMIRESNAPGAKQVAIFSNQTNILRHETRYSNNTPKQINSFHKPFPFWLRLERTGSWVFTYYSTNGTTFQYIHGVYVPMQECVEIGLSSFTYQAFSQTEAVFSFVSVQGGNGLDNEEAVVLAKTNVIDATLTSTLFPNPANEVIYLDFFKPISEKTNLQLMNKFGQLIDEKILEIGTSSASWQIKSLPVGVYFIQVKMHGNVQKTLKWIKID